MIPALANIIAAYVLFRMVEVLLLPTSHFAGSFQRVLACIFAGIAGIFIFFNLVGIWLSGSSATKLIP